MGPYREARKLLSCPRCGDLIDDLHAGVWLCVACEGLWISKPALAKLTDLWPVGSPTWWRNSLVCPECHLAGKDTTMRARMAGQIMVDECPKHGGWFDRGELSRILRSMDDDLATLRTRLALDGATIEEIEARRAKRERELEQRRRANTAFVSAEEARRLARDERARDEARRRDEDQKRADIEGLRRVDRDAALAMQRMRVEQLAGQVDDAEARVRQLESIVGEAHREMERLREQLDRDTHRLGVARDELVETSRLLARAREPLA